MLIMGIQLCFEELSMNGMKLKKLVSDIIFSFQYFVDECVWDLKDKHWHQDIIESEG